MEEVEGVVEGGREAGEAGAGEIGVIWRLGGKV
jgi:hypothetical protein